MKKLIFSFLAVMTLTFISCKKDGSGSDSGGSSCNLPSTEVPDNMVGVWASGYNSWTDIVDVYDGRYLGNNWQSGKVFRFSKDGKNAEFFYMANSGLYSSSATRAIGTVTFNDDNSFTFHCCKAHYKGWQNGSMVVDRDATDKEVADNGLTRKYYYSFDTSGPTTWMVIRFDPNDEYGTSFEMVN
jgi:hypothetical protein